MPWYYFLSPLYRFVFAQLRRVCKNKLEGTLYTGSDDGSVNRTHIGLIVGSVSIFNCLEKVKCECISGCNIGQTNFERLLYKRTADKAHGKHHGNSKATAQHTFVTLSRHDYMIFTSVSTLPGFINGYLQGLHGFKHLKPNTFSWHCDFFDIPQPYLLYHFVHKSKINLVKIYDNYSYFFQETKQIHGREGLPFSLAIFIIVFCQFTTSLGLISFMLLLLK